MSCHTQQMHETYYTTTAGFLLVPVWLNWISCVCCWSITMAFKQRQTLKGGVSQSGALWIIADTMEQLETACWQGGTHGWLMISLASTPNEKWQESRWVATSWWTTIPMQMQEEFHAGNQGNCSATPSLCILYALVISCTSHGWITSWLENEIGVQRELVRANIV